MKGVRSTALRFMALCAIAMVACVMAFVLAGCSSGSGSASASASASSASASASAASASASAASGEAAAETRTFTDSTGRTVEIPANIERVAATGAISQQVLFTIAPDKLVGLCDEMTDLEQKYIGAQYASLPIFGQIYGGKGSFNKEAVAAADPQLIIDIGEAKKGIVEDLDELQASIGVPCVHIEATLDTWPQAYEMLGELLGEQERAKVIADYIAASYQKTLDGLAKVAPEDRVKGAYLLGDAGLNAMPKGTFNAGVVDLAFDNVVEIENAKGSGLGSEVSFEQVALWDPEFIIFAPESIYASAGDDPAWQTVAAIANKNYYEVPGVPYNWVSTPPSINQVIGIQWLARLCYPDQFDDDINQVVKEYFSTMYNYEMSDAELQELLANSMPRA